MAANNWRKASGCLPKQVSGQAPPKGQADNKKEIMEEENVARSRDTYRSNSMRSKPGWDNCFVSLPSVFGKECKGTALPTLGKHIKLLPKVLILHGEALNRQMLRERAVRGYEVARPQVRSRQIWSAKRCGEAEVILHQTKRDQPLIPADPFSKSVDALLAEQAELAAIHFPVNFQANHVDTRRPARTIQRNPFDVRPGATPALQGRAQLAAGYVEEVNASIN